MKILAIRLKNLASLAGEQEIDFTREPLSSAGLFAITGPTGAGKSTVLDALCLALFGSTPRLESTSASSKVPDGRNELSSNDERNLLRRGCASGYAEVDFVGIDGHRYRARWETRRSRDKADGALQKSQQSLQDLETQQMLAANKKSEFREQLEQKLGLNFAQFTRAVLLAQSEFSAFLKASDNDRGALLEKLTDTGLYSQLSKAAYQRARPTSSASNSSNAWKAACPWPSRPGPGSRRRWNPTPRRVSRSNRHCNVWKASNNGSPRSSGCCNPASTHKANWPRPGRPGTPWRRSGKPCNGWSAWLRFAD
nr:AAA family ATPase [Pseudomonas aeruginosa]